MRSHMKIPWAEEPGKLQSMGSLRVGHDWVTSLSLFTFMHWRRKWQPTPVLLPGESQGQGSLVGFRLWGRTESDTLKWCSSSSSSSRWYLTSQERCSHQRSQSSQERRLKTSQEQIRWVDEKEWWKGRGEVRKVAHKSGGKAGTCAIAEAVEFHRGCHPHPFSDQNSS